MILNEDQILRLLVGSWVVITCSFKGRGLGGDKGGGGGGIGIFLRWSGVMGLIMGVEGG